MLKIKVILHEHIIDFDDAVNLMHNDIRERLNSTWMSAGTQQEDCQRFLNEYVAAHLIEFNEIFEV